MGHTLAVRLGVEPVASVGAPPKVEAAAGAARVLVEVVGRVGVTGVGVLVDGAGVLPVTEPPPPPLEQAARARRQTDDASRKAVFDRSMIVSIFMRRSWQSQPRRFSLT